MTPIIYNQISVLTSAVGIGLPLGSPSTYNAATAYSVGNTALYPSLNGVASQAANWYCIKAGTGKTPSSNPSYWIELDTNGIPVLAVYAAIQCEGADVRWTDDGLTTPTSAIGNILPYNANTYPLTELLYNRGPLRNVKIIQASATAKANITFYQN
jgi:hypothetical protein